MPHLNYQWREYCLLFWQLNQDDLLELFVKAITCNILGKTGPQRTRNLGLLYKVKHCISEERILPLLILSYSIRKDSRLESLQFNDRYASHPIVLEKMFKEQIVRKEEVAAFETYLMEHQKAVCEVIASVLDVH